MAAVPLHLAKTKLCLFTVNSGAAVDLPDLDMSCLVLLFFLSLKSLLPPLIVFACGFICNFSCKNVSCDLHFSL